MTGNENISLSGQRGMIPAAAVLLLALLLGYFIATSGTHGAFVLLALPAVLGLTFLILRKPRTGIIAVVAAGFLMNGVSRYIDGPVGLAIDFLLCITAIGVLFLKNPSQFRRAGNILTWLTVLWFLYTVVELFNPLAPSKAAWFYAVRGVSLYNLFLIPLAFVLFSSRRDLKVFIRIWMAFSAVAVLWAVRQVYLGPDSAEMRWLSEGGAITHIIQNRLRAFSFYSDAGQFGAAMAHAGLVALILGLGPGVKRRWLLFAVSLLCFYGMLLSGTRGALYIPIAGMMAFLLLMRNFKIFAGGLVLFALVFSFLKFTTIGQGDFTIRRMRSALDPKEKSLEVRQENQKKIAVYLRDKPFGAGIGSGGSWALRFAPDSFLATTPLDSWYVKIWAETGIVGLVLHLGIILFLLAYGFFAVFRCSDAALKYQLAALYSGFAGMALASYGNQLLGQSPTIIVVGLSLVFLFSVKRLTPRYANS